MLGALIAAPLPVIVIEEVFALNVRFVVTAKFMAVDGLLNVNVLLFNVIVLVLLLLDEISVAVTL
jgi:hypothetical protein